jgi:hypothetical protein
MKRIINALFICIILCVAACSKSENGFTVNRKGTITSYKGQETSLAIPSMIGNRPVTAIGEQVFVSYNLKNITIPEGVFSIGNMAFCNNDMKSIIIPDSVNHIGDGAFSLCQYLTFVKIPSDITYIGERVFSCNQLTNVIIPEGVTSIGKEAFSYNQLTSVIIPSSVMSIREEAFAKNQLTSVTIPDNTSISLTAFIGIFTTIIIGNNVTFTKDDVNYTIQVDYFAHNNFVEFVDFYNANSKKAGTYKYDNDIWVIISDVYYYRLGVNEYKNGNYEGAIYWLNILKEMYPKSTYIESADKIIINSQPKPMKGERDELEYSRRLDEIRKKFQNENLSEDEFMALFYELLGL